MNWFGNQKGDHLLVIASGVALMVQGGGKWSLDGRLGRRRPGSLE